MLFRTYGQAILVAHERVSRILILARQPAKLPSPPRATHRLARALPPELRQTIAFDNGTEFAEHYRLKPTSDPNLSSRYRTAPGKRA